MTTKQTLFVEAYIGPAKGNATEAARMAGYSGNSATLAQVGHENLRKPEIASLVEARLAAAQMEAHEMIAELTRVARLQSSLPAMVACKVRALEILAKFHGLLSEKLLIQLDRQAIERELEECTERLTAVKRLPPPAA